jgi:hypothetical protein
MPAAPPSSAGNSTPAAEKYDRAEPQAVASGRARRGAVGGHVHEHVSVLLTDLGDGRTETRFEQRGRMSPEQYERAGQGWASFFDRVAERVAETSSVQALSRL